MKHTQYKEWLTLSLYDELDGDERSLLDRHLEHCSECAGELAELRKMHERFTSARSSEKVGELLSEARAELRIALRAERNRSPWWEGVRAAIEGVLQPRLQVAFGSVALVAVGFVVGFVIFRTASPDQPGLYQQISSANETASINRGGAEITNVHFLRRDDATGDIEMTFDAITPVHILGNVNDDRVQKVLARAVMSEQNPGIRLRAVGAIAERPGTQNEDVKKVLINVLKYDENRGVRKEALGALQKYVPDPEVTEAILYVLKNEKNTGMKILAINSLDISKYEGQPGKEALMTFLKERAHTDENNYIRIRAKAALQEAK
jgi:hypothetical protein